MKRPVPGQLIRRFPTNDYRRILNSVESGERFGPAMSALAPADQLHVVNTTGQHLDQFAVLQIGQMPLTPESFADGGNPAAWFSNMVFDGSLPPRKHCGVKFRVDASQPPPSSLTDERYLLDDSTPVHADWDGATENDIVQFDGTDWIATTPAAGDIVEAGADVLGTPTTAQSWEFVSADHGWTKHAPGRLAGMQRHFAVLQQTAAQDSIVPAVGFDLTRCRLQVAGEWHTRATPHNVTSLRSSVAGTARIVWREKLTQEQLDDVRAGTLVEVWAVVSLGHDVSHNHEGYLLEPLNEATIDSDGQLVPGVARIATYASTNGRDELGNTVDTWIRTGQLTASTYSIGGVSGATAGTYCRTDLSPDGTRNQFTVLDCGPLGNDDYNADEVLDLTINADDECYE